LLIDGIDPIAARDARRAREALADAQAVTFKHCAEEYLLDSQASSKSAVHRRQWASTLKTYVYPEIGHVPASSNITAPIQCRTSMASAIQTALADPGQRAGKPTRNQRDTLRMART